MTALIAAGTVVGIGASAPYAIADRDPTGWRTKLADPPRHHRPGVFWWWPGTEVTAAGTGAEIRALTDAGFGSAQIIDQEGGPVQGGGLTWQWGTPQWFERVATAYQQGNDAGVRIDGAQYPNWPMSSPVATANHELAAQALHAANVELRGPFEFIGPPPDPIHVIGAKRLVAVTAARPVGGRGTVLDPATATDLTARVGADGLLRWSVPAGTWRLFGFWRRPTGQVPETIGGVLRSLTLDQVPPGMFDSDLLVVDHFNPDATQAALDWIDRNVPAQTDGLRRTNAGELYEDSLELTVGVGSGLFWTPRLLAEFKQRRGYDLTPFLATLFFPMQHTLFAPLELFALPGLEHAPVPLPGVGAEGAPDFALPNGLGTRVRHDYYRTLTDLFIEHLKVLDRWRRARGLSAFRHQAYGTTIDSSRAQAAVGTPDTETFEAGSPQPAGSAGSQGTVDFYRVAAGAAHISGSRHVNAESGDVFAFERCPKGICVFGEEPDDYWKIVNHAYAGGVTHIQIHGLSYQDVPEPPRTSSWLGPQTWPWPGWSAMFNAFAEPWNVNWPQWRFWPGLTTYMGRASQLLSSGRPRVDLLFYRDDFVNGVSGLPPTRRREDVTRAGYTYDFADPVTLAEHGAVRDRRLFPDRAAYKALVVDLENTWAGGMPGETAAALERFARRGLPIVFVGAPPTHGTSAADPAGEDRRVRSAIARLRARRNVRQVAHPAGLPGALRALGVAPDAAWSTPSLVHAVQRRTPTHDVFYLWNEADEPVALTATLRTRGRPYEHDVWNNVTRPLVRFRQHGGTMRVPLQLGKHEARWIVVDRSRRALPHVWSTTADRVRARGDRLALEADRPGRYRARLSDGRTVGVRIGALPAAIALRAWTLRVAEFTPHGAPIHELELADLRDWQAIPTLRDRAGAGRYTATIDLPAQWLRRGRAVDLDLGTVHGASRARVNGRLVTAATLRLPGERHRVTRLLRAGANTIEVDVATPPLNALRGLALRGDVAYAPFLPLPANPAGMIGPVRLVPVGTATVHARR